MGRRSQSPFGLFRHLDHGEELFRLEVVFSRLVDNPQLAAPLGRRVVDHLVELAASDAMRLVPM